MPAWTRGLEAWICAVEAFPLLCHVSAAKSRVLCAVYPELGRLPSDLNSLTCQSHSL